MALSIQGAGPGFFLPAPNQKMDVLRQNTVFEPPGNEFRNSNVAPDNQVFRDPDTEDDQLRERTDQSVLENNSLNSIFAPVPTEVRLGQSLDRLEQSEEAPPRGGSTLTVSGNNVTVTNAGGESVSFDAEDSGRLIRTEDDRLLLRNDSEETSVELGSNVDVTTEGDGELTVFGEDEAVTVQAGNSFETDETQGELTVRNPSTASSLELGDETSLLVESTNPDETDVLTISASGGGFLEFEQGESGSVQRNDDGTLTVENETSGESVTFNPDEGFSTGGEAEGTLVNEATAGTLTLEADREFSVDTDEDGTTTVRDETSAESTSVAPEDEPLAPSRPVQLQFFENLQNRGLQQLSGRLLRPSEANDIRAGTENRNSEQENRSVDSDEEENETILANEEDDEDSTLATESPLERSDGSKFGELRDETGTGLFRGNEFSIVASNESDEPPFNQSSLQVAFDVFGQSEESTFSTTV